MCNIDFLRLLKLGVISDPKQYRKNLAITFNKLYISICIIKFGINGERFDSIAQTVLNYNQNTIGDVRSVVKCILNKKRKFIQLYLRQYLFYENDFDIKLISIPFSVGRYN